MLEIKTVLNKSMLFKNLDIHLIDEMSRCFNIDEWPKGSFPYNENHTIKRFYIVLSGRIKIYQTNPVTGKEYTIFILQEGDVFDVISLLDEQKHEIQTEAIDKITIGYTSIENVREWIIKHKKFSENLFKYLGHRMRKLEQAAVDVSIIDTATRLAKLLFLNIDNNSHQLNLISNLTNTEIAHLIGSTGAVVNRHLQELKKENILELHRKEILIKNLSLLENKVHQYL